MTVGLKDSPETAHASCMTTLEAGAGNMPRSPEAKKYLDQALKNFRDNIDVWNKDPVVRDKVHAAATAIGEIAASLTRLMNAVRPAGTPAATTLGEREVREAVLVVKPRCNAALPLDKVGKGRFCQDL